MSAPHVIFGSGPLGRAVAIELLRRGQQVTMVSRRGLAAVDGVTALAGDATNAEFVADATRGASVVYQCAQPAYNKWADEFPALQSSILAGAAVSGARLVIGDNLYSYGDPHGAIISETSPREPATRKGKVRKSMADAAMEAHRNGVIEVTISRPSDYFGPGYDVTGNTLFKRALDGRAVQLIGTAGVPHSFSYVPDAGAAMATLGLSEQSWGEVWIPPVQKPITQKSFAELVWVAAGNTGKIKTQVLGRPGITVLGAFIPELREIREMLYEFEKPFIVDSTKYESVFGVQATPLEDAISETLSWYRG